LKLNFVLTQLSGHVPLDSDPEYFEFYCCCVFDIPFSHVDSGISGAARMRPKRPCSPLKQTC